MGFFTRLVNRSKHYNFIRYSRFSDFVVECLTGKTRKNREFYTLLASEETWKGRLVFDVGANKGNKTRAFLDLGAEVVSIEPERKALETLEYRFGTHPRVVIVPQGVSDSPGEVRLFVKDYRSGYNTLSDKWQKEGEALDTPIDSYPVRVTTLTDLMQNYGKPFYIKIDVEGFELPVIRGLKEPVPLLSFEANLPEFHEETQSILDHLIGLYPGSARVRIFLRESPIGDWMDLSSASQYLNKLEGHGIELVVRS